MRALTVFGQRVEAHLERLGVSHDEFAERVGMSRTTLWRRLTGRTELTLTEAEAIARELGVELADLTGRVEIVAGQSHAERGPSDAGERGGASGDTDYAPNPALRQNVPPRAYEAVLGFLKRLARAGLPPERIERYETQLLDRRWSQRQRGRYGTDPGEEEWLDRVEELWQIIREALAGQGITV